MIIGFGISSIIPPAMVPMAGYDLRQEKAEGVYDPLSVRVLLTGDKTTLAALVTYDLLGVPLYLVSQVKAAATACVNRVLQDEQTGWEQRGPLLTEEAVFVLAIHTHAAPKVHFRSFSIFDPAYEQQLCEAACEAAEEAAKDLSETTLSAKSLTAEGVAAYRDTTREASRFAMPVDMFWFERKDKDPITLLLMRTHPTVLNETNLLMSRDLVLGIDKAFQDAHPGARLMVINGACADVSTRYTRKESTFQEAERLGRLLAKAALKDPGPFRPLNALAVCSETLTIPPARFFTEEERQDIITYLTGKIEACQDAAEKREYIACRSVLERTTYGKTPEGGPKEGITVAISALRLGGTRENGTNELNGQEGLDMVFLPFEYANKDDQDLCQALEKQTGRRAIVVCYANGYEGYLPSGKPLSKDSGYEDIASPYREDAKDLVKACCMRLLSKEGV